MNLKIPNSSGKNLAVVIHKPETKTEKLAIICPGFLDTKNYAGLTILANELSNRGYTAVRFDPTGTWQSEGSISEYLTTQYLQDVKSIIDYMMKEGNYTDILLCGHSMGGYISMLYASQDKRISTVVDIMGPYSINMIGQNSRLDEWKNNGFRKSTRDIPNSIEIKEFKVPYSFAEDRLKYNVLDVIQKVKIPILFIAGEKDTTVTPEQIKTIFDKANEPKKMVVVPEIGHSYRHNTSEIENVNKVVVDFLNQFK